MPAYPSAITAIQTVEYDMGLCDMVIDNPWFGTY